MLTADGHILWTLREDIHNKNSDYGLLDENLAALERSGKCHILRMGEKFTDKHSGATGVEKLYSTRSSMSGKTYF